MNKLIHLLIIGLAISSCSRQIYIYKTKDFTINQGSQVDIQENNSMKCPSYYSPACLFG